MARGGCLGIIIEEKSKAMRLKVGHTGRHPSGGMRLLFQRQTLSAPRRINQSSFPHGTPPSPGTTRQGLQGVAGGWRISSRSDLTRGIHSDPSPPSLLRGHKDAHCTCTVGVGHSLENSSTVLRDQMPATPTRERGPAGSCLGDPGPTMGTVKDVQPRAPSSCSPPSWGGGCPRKDHTPRESMLSALSPHTHSHKRHTINKYQKMWFSSQSHLASNPSHHWQPP